MTGTIELDKDGKFLLIGFPYRDDLVEEVRNLPGRRWDRGSKQWRVPIAHAELVVSTFMKYGFEMSGDVAGVLAGTGGTPPAAADAPPDAEAAAAPNAAATADDGGMTVSALNEKARETLRAAFSGRVRLVGEVVDFDKSRERTHIFFSLVEKAGHGDKIKATVDAALFARTAQRVLPKIEQQGLTMRDGIQIMAKVSVDLYPANGRFQVIIEDIEPEFTLGKLALSREQILADLRRRGLDRINLERPWPVPALRIGVLTSDSSDGWNDFRREIESSGIGFDVTLYPVRVQGKDLERSMLAGLAWFAERAADFDLLCVVRGGGSRTDLAWFDNQSVSVAAAEHPLKIVCGIGHERDRSVLDEICASFKTPTAVAAALVGQHAAVRDVLEDTARRVAVATTARLGKEQGRLRDLGQALRREVHGRIVRERSGLESAEHRLATAARTSLKAWRSALELRASRLVNGTRSLLRDGARRLADRQARIAHAAARRTRDETAKLQGHATRLRLLDPRRVLERGYAIIRKSSGDTIATGASSLEPGDGIGITFRDGAATARVDTVHVESSPRGDDAPQPED